MASKSGMTTPLDNLIRALAKLPGLGKRSAERAALALLRKPELLSDPLVLALNEARAQMVCCRICGSFTSAMCNPCRFCVDSAREAEVLCVVEDPADVFAIENSGGYRGRYHVLMGKLSPARKQGPNELRFKSLTERLVRGGIREVLLALSTDMEGDATASYLVELLKPYGVQVTRLAFGLPADSGVGYSDPLTLKRAIPGRINYD